MAWLNQGRRIILGRLSKASLPFAFNSLRSLQCSGNAFRLYSSVYPSGSRVPPFQEQFPTETADDFESRLFGDVFDEDTDTFFRKLDRAEKALGKTNDQEDWNVKFDENELEGLSQDTLADGMDEKLKNAALGMDYGAGKIDPDYSFRPDTAFEVGTMYSVQDLDLTKPTVQKPPKKLQFETTSREVLKKADFRNVKFLQKFITEAGIIYPRKKFRISAKAQRKIAREIKTARAFGLMPFTCMGKKPFVYGRTMEDLDNDYYFDQYKDEADDIQDDDLELDVEETNL